MTNMRDWVLFQPGYVIIEENFREKEGRIALRDMKESLWEE